VWVDRLAAPAADQAGFQPMTTALVGHLDTRSMRRGHPERTPLVQRQRERKQVESFLGEPVFVAGRLVLIEVLFDDACRQQKSQSIREDVGRDTQHGVDVVVSMQAEEKRREQQCGPAIADGVDRMKHGGIDALDVARGRSAFASPRGTLSRDGVPSARTWHRRDVLQAHRFVAMHAGERRVEVVTAAAMLDPRRQAVFAGPALLPTPHAQRDRVEIEALLGQSIFETVRRFAVRNAVQHTVFDEGIEARGERAARSSGTTAEIFETTDSQEGITQDEERPAISDRLECAGTLATAQQMADRVDVLWQLAALHEGRQFNTRGVSNR